MPFRHSAPRILRVMRQAALLLALGASSLGAQGPAPRVERTVEGRIVRPIPGVREPRPVAGIQVVLHRIGRDSAGPIDSVRTRADGRYAFRYRAAEDSDATFVVSAEHGGIAYFAPPLQATVVDGDDAEIVVFDTTSSPVPITVRSRHVIVSAADEGERQVLELYELSNDTLLTAVPGDRERAVWTAVAPESAHDFTVPGEQGVSGSALRLVDGRVLLLAPFSPGIRQFAFTYRVPAGEASLRLPIERPTGALEVMLEEPTASATAPGLAEVEPMAVEGRTFRRFVAANVPGNGVLAVEMPPPPPSSRAIYIAVTVISVGVLMLLVLARAFARRGAPRPRGGIALPSATLEQRIAALDAAFARFPEPSDEAREAYGAQRAALVEARDAALAREGVRS